MTIFFPPLVVSSVLRETAELKIEELNRDSAAFKERYEPAYESRAAGDDILKRLNALLERIQELDPSLEKDDDLPILTRYVEQAQNDRSISQDKLAKLEKGLLDKLDHHSNRLEVSKLHVELLKEAFDAQDSSTPPTAKLGEVALDDEFEIVEGELEAVFETFEKNAFASKDVDTNALEAYLSNLFENGSAKEQLTRLRNGMKTYGEDVISGEEEVDDDLVNWCIGDLLKNELLSDEKKRTLQSYLESPPAVNEIRDTLNAKSIRHWNWRNAEKGLPVTAHQNAEGKYCITIEEDIIDMLFLHSLAVRWSMNLKECLKETICVQGVWPGNKTLDSAETEWLEYYLFAPRPKVASCSTCHGPPLGAPPPPPDVCPPPPPLPPVFRPRKKVRKSYPPPPPPIHDPFSLDGERSSTYRRDFFLSRLPNREDYLPKNTRQHETQSILLKTLATEAKLREAFDGCANTLTANFTSFASSLSHQTILTVLKFLGVPEPWLGLFSRFLSAPLNMGPVVRGTSDRVLTRKCGIPVAHGLETFFSEAVLFFVDLAVHQKTGSYLYRLRDRCYFVGRDTQHLRATHAIERFAQAMRLDCKIVNRLDTEAISFLTFETPTEVTIQPKVDNIQVEAYAHRVKKQLATCGTVIEWIRTWNYMIGTYASHRFGPLANVFGKSHLEAVTQAYNRMHDIIFDGSNLTDHVKNLLHTHLGRPLSDPPFALEALLYLPHVYGGLGIKNPYITLNLARKIPEDPGSRLDAYLRAEQRYYDAALKTFNDLTTAKRADKLKSIFEDDAEHMERVLGEGTDPAIFPTMWEIFAKREQTAYPFLPPSSFQSWMGSSCLPSLVLVYQKLVKEPKDHMIPSERTDEEVSRLSGTNGMKRWFRMSGEDQWAVQMYGDECFERYGGLQCWHAPSVPREVLEMVRGEIADLDDDDSSA